MVGKRIQFNDETFEAILAVARQRGRTFQQLSDEAFKIPEKVWSAGRANGFLALVARRPLRRECRAVSFC
jgi:hypothetical protein